MADIESNIGINIDAAGALSALKNLQRQISVFHQTMAKSGAVSNAQLSNMQQNLVNGINATGQFSASIQRVKTSTESFTQALEKNKLSMGQYFRFAGSQVTGFRKVFSTEFDTIDKVARERVKTLQTQYIKLGRDASGAMQAIAVRPQVLDMKDLGTQTAIASQKAQLFNQLMKQGSTELLNFGKNTQWAGRQLMVGFTVPLGIMASAAMKEFKAIEEQVIRLERVYGDFTTTMSDTEQMTQQIKDLGTEFTKYGVAVSKTLGLAADAAAMGKTGADLVAQVAEANRLAVLGAVDQQQSLETTISLTNAFGVASDQLAGKVNFLNAVENQTVTSIQDLTEAIPKAGPVIQQLGGNVEDLTFFLTAMKEGGINASEGANALKSGLASLINPTGEAVTMLEKFGINLQGIVEANRGNVRGIVTDFAKALDTLDPTNRAQAIEQLFGKFQFSRLSTLFQNVIAEGSQASRVLQLTKSSAAELASLSERELKRVEDSPLYKFQGAVERFKASLAPIGEEFMKAVTPFVEFGTKILDGFNSWGDGAKQFAVLAVTAVGAIGPVLIMTFGLLANGIANMIKGMLFVRNGFKGVGAQSNVLTEQLNYMNSEQLEAASVAASLNQVHNNLIQTFTSEAGAVRNLAAAYGQGIAAQSAFMGGTLAKGKGAAPKKMATGGIFKGPGTGTSDSIPAMVSNGEAIIPAATVKKFPGMVAGLIAGNIPGFAEGTGGQHFAHIGGGVSITPSQAIGSGMAFTGKAQNAIESLSGLDIVDPIVRVLHSWGARIDRSANLLLAKTGETPGNLAKEFGGGPEASANRWNESIKLAGADASDPELAKQLQKYDSTMVGKLKGLEKSGVTHIVDTEDMIAKVPESQKHLYRSLESLDKEVISEVGAQNKKLAGVREKALNTARDVRIDVPTGSDAYNKVAEDERASRAFRRSRGEGKGYRYGVSVQAKTAGGMGDMPYAAGANNKKAAKKIVKKTQDSLAEEIATEAEVASPSKKTKRAAKGMVDGVVAAIVDGRDDVVKAQKGTSQAQALALKTNTNPAFGKVAAGAKAPVMFSPGQMQHFLDQRNKKPPVIPNLFDAQNQAYSGKMMTGKELQFTRGVRLLDAAQMLKPMNMLDAAMKATANGAKIAATNVKNFSVRTAEVAKTVGTNMVSAMKTLGESAKQTAVSIGTSAKNIAKSTGSRIMGSMTGGKLGGLGMAASMGLMFASGQEGPVGEIAGKIAMPLMAISTLGPMIMSLGPVVGTAVVAIGALVGGVIAYNVAIDNARKTGQELADSMSLTKDKMDKLSDVTGKQAISAAEQQKRDLKIASIKAGMSQERATEIGAFQASFKGSDAGKVFLEDVQKQIKNGTGIAEVAQNMSSQLASAVAEGVLSKEQADAISESLAESIKNKQFDIELKGHLNTILGPNGENVTKDPGAVANAITEQSAARVSGQEAKSGKVVQEATLNKNISAGVGAGMMMVGAGMTAAGAPTVLGAIPGLLVMAAGLGAYIWDATTAEAEMAKQAGLVAGLTAEAYNQNIKMTDVINSRYGTLVKEKQAQIAAATTDEQRVKYNQELKLLQEAQASAMERQKQSATTLLENADKNKAKLGDTKWDAAQKEQIKKTYKDDTVMQQLAEAQYNRASDDNAIQNRVIQTTLEVQIASGQLSPAAAEKLIDSLDKDINAQGNYEIMVKTMGQKESIDLAEQLTAAGATGETLKKQMEVVVNAKTAEGMKKASNEIKAMAALAANMKSNGIKININDSGDQEKLKSILADISALDALREKGPVTVELIAKTTGIELMSRAKAIYESLPPGDQKTFIDEYVTIIRRFDTANASDQDELHKWGKDNNKLSRRTYTDTNAFGVKTTREDWDYAAIAEARATESAQRAVLTAQQRAASLPAVVPPNKDTGGGSTTKEPEKPPTSFLDSVVKDIKTFVNAAQGLTENFQDSMNAIRSASASAFGGLSQQLRGVGLGEDVIQLMTGMSKEDWDQYKDQFFNFDGAGNVTGFKSDLISIADKLRTITLGKFVDEQQKTLVNLRDQSSALTKLVSLGMSYADAYKLVEDAALAAAIANAKSAEEIKKIIDLANQARQAQDVVNASKSLADTNKVTDATIAGLNAVIRFNGALTDTQTEAILASQELQTMLANFDTLSINQLKVLNEALQDAANKEALEIKIKMQTPEGMQELFNDGFSKAMEQFSAKEQEIKIKFTALKNPFQDIIDEFTNRIEDIKNRPGGLDDLEADLQRISEQETDVNEKYKKRFEALDQISKINDRIAAQQRTQLSLADALSQGDIAAAARAAQEIRAADAAQVLVDQREALQKSQELEIESLRGNMGLSRKQLEEQIRQLKIDIFNIEEQSIEPAQREIELLTRKEELETNSLTVLNKTKEEWEKIKNEVELARVGTAKYEADITRAKDLVQGVIDKWKNVPAEVTTIHKIIEKKISEAEAAAPAPADTPAPLPATTPAPQNRGQYRVKSGDTLWAIAQQYYGNGNLWTKIYDANRGVIGGNPNYILPGQVYTIPLAKGGMVPRYLANGGFPSIGTDTVPAMLTPGEFVVKKYAVENFGADKLKAINNGTYDGGSVYNYNMSVNVRSDANPDEIARTVMAQIKRVDSQRIRGNKF